ncbi:hypothetical protein TCAL_13929 [Tigriopus californicus]|uniref:Ig-like domain-containing protein n=2 Tax=Tigriopus californicus TaxID=6832 RepID=A0A553NNJ3_TIGCA|nr:hypothetical protein TCAL_13929 [Tigriopus californicus]
MWHKQQEELVNQLQERDFQIQKDFHQPTGTLVTSTEMPVPSFKLESNTSVVISAGQTAYLHCLIQNLGDRSVSWIRRSDLMVLTIGEIAYTQDKRFTPIHENGSEVWILKIKSPEVDDTGEYECQLSYHEDEEQRYSLAFSLKVLNSRAYIQDDRDLHVEKGSRLSLSCSILEPSAPPDYVLWYHDGKVLNYSPLVNILTDTSQAAVTRGARGGTSDSSSSPSETSGTFEARPRADMKRQRSLKDTNGGDDENDGTTAKRDVDGNSHPGDSNEPQTSVMDTNKANEKTTSRHNGSVGGVVSKLSIDNVRRALHSGNYTCEPSNARAASITVHIVDDDSGPAAMQHGNGSRATFPGCYQGMLFHWRTILLILVLSWSR